MATLLCFTTCQGVLGGTSSVNYGDFAFFEQVMSQELQKLQVFSTNRDGSPLPPGSQRIYMTSVIFDFMLDLVAHLLEDPMNGIIYPANEPWNDPAKLVTTLTFGCCQVHTPSGAIPYTDINDFLDPQFPSYRGIFQVPRPLCGCLSVVLLRSIADPFQNGAQTHTKPMCSMITIMY